MEEELMKVADVRPLTMRYRQGRLLENTVWALLLGTEDPAYNSPFDPVPWSQKEIKERLSLIFSDYDRMARQVQSDA